MKTNLILKKLLPVMIVTILWILAMFINVGKTYLMLTALSATAIASCLYMIQGRVNIWNILISFFTISLLVYPSFILSSAFNKDINIHSAVKWGAIIFGVVFWTIALFLIAQLSKQIRSKIKWSKFEKQNVKFLMIMIINCVIYFALMALPMYVIYCDCVLLKILTCLMIPAYFVTVYASDIALKKIEKN